MKQIGNLAIVCAQRPDVLMQIYGGTVSIHIGEGPERATLSAAWEDDNTIQDMIRELNFGRYAAHPRKKEKVQHDQKFESAQTQAAAGHTLGGHRPLPARMHRPTAGGHMGQYPGCLHQNSQSARSAHQCGKRWAGLHNVVGCSQHLVI